VRTPSIFTPSPLSQETTRLSLAGEEIDADVLAADARLGGVDEMTFVLPAVLRQREDRRVRTLVIEHNGGPWSSLAERDDREIEHVAMSALPGDREAGDPLSVRREPRRNFGPRPAGQATERAGVDLDRPQIVVLVDAEADRLAVGRPVRRDDDGPAVRRPLRLSVPCFAVADPLDPRRSELVRCVGQVGDPDLSRSVAGISLSLVGTHDDDIGLDLLLGPRVRPILGDEDELPAVRREGDPPVERIVEDAAIRFLRAGERNGGSSRGRDEPEIDGDFRFRRRGRRLLPSLRSRPGRQEDDPLTVGRKDRRPRVGLPVFHRLAVEPERRPLFTGAGIDPAAGVRGAVSGDLPGDRGRRP